MGGALIAGQHRTKTPFEPDRSYCDTQPYVCGSTQSQHFHADHHHSAAAAEVPQPSRRSDLQLVRDIVFIEAPSNKQPYCPSPLLQLCVIMITG